MALPKKFFEADTAVFPLFYQMAMLTWLQRKGAKIDQLLKGTSITMEMFCDPESRVSFHTLSKFVSNAESFWGKPGLGLAFGSKLSLSSIGTVGQVCMSSATNRESCRMFETFFSTRTMTMNMELKDTKNSLTFLFDCKVPEARMDRYYVDTCLAAVQRFLNMLLNKDVVCCATLQSDDGGYADQYLEMFGGGVDFNQTYNSVSFFSDTLDKPLRSSDPLTFARSQKRATIELHKAGGVKSVYETVKSIIGLNYQDPPTLQVIADEVGISPRSLQRHLSEKNSSYRDCVDQVRSKHAKGFLNNHDLTVSVVAEKLGYDSPANFNRAFKRWFNMSPSQYRLTQ